MQEASAVSETSTITITPPTGNGMTRKGSALAVGVLLLASFLLYIPSYHAEFVSLDDHQYVFENQLILHGGWDAIVRFFTEVIHPSTVSGYYQPLTMISLMLDARLDSSHGVDSLIYHLGNILWHAINCVLVFFIVRKIVRNDVIALLAAAFFLIHPVQVESVTWISQRKTVLATAFALGSVLAYLHYGTTLHKRFLIFSVLLYAVGLLAKPTIMLLPIALLLLDIWPLRRPLRQAFLDKLLFVPVMLILAYIAWVSQVQAAALMSPKLDSGDRIMKWIGLLSYNLILYLGNLVWPLTLSPYRDVPKEITFNEPELLWATIGAALLVVIWITSWKWSRSFFVGVTAFIVLLTPALGAVRFTQSCVSDRFLYLPMVFLLLPLGVGIDRLRQIFPLRTKQIETLIALFLAPLAALTFAQQSIWQNSATLWYHIATTAPRNIQANQNAAIIYHMTADYERARMFAERAVEAQPSSAQSLHLLGRAQTRTGDPDKAIGNIQQALKIGLGSKEGWGHIALAEAYLLLGREAEARNEMAAAKVLGLDRAEILADLADFSLIFAKRCDWALELYQQLSNTHPDDLDAHYRYADALRKCGKESDAIIELKNIQQKAQQKGLKYPKVEADLAEIEARKNSAPPSNSTMQKNAS